MSVTPVQWPAKACAADGTDLSAPTTQLLKDLKLLEDPGTGEKVTWKDGTPLSRLTAKVDGDLKPVQEWAGIIRCAPDTPPMG